MRSFAALVACTVLSSSTIAGFPIGGSFQQPDGRVAAPAPSSAIRACSVLPKEEVRTILGVDPKTFNLVPLQEDSLPGGGSACEYMGAASRSIVPRRQAHGDAQDIRADVDPDSRPWGIRLLQRLNETVPIRGALCGVPQPCGHRADERRSPRHRRERAPQSGRAREGAPGQAPVTAACSGAATRARVL